MDNQETYFDRAWRDLSADEDWWKAIFAFGLLNCVPIIGQIIMFGYLFDWAKEAAWGMHTPLSHKLGDIGLRVKYGLTAAWVMIIWVVPVLIIAWALGFIPVAGPVIRFFVQVLAVVVCAISAAAALRSIIYEHVMPGLQVGRVLKMVRKNPGGLAQSFCIILLVLPLLFAALFIVLLPTIPFINLIATTTVSSALGADLAILVFLGMLTMVVALVVWVVCAIVSALISAMYVRSLGYWMASFEPAKWKSPTSPMPFELEENAKKSEKKNKKDKKKKHEDQTEEKPEDKSEAQSEEQSE